MKKTKLSVNINKVATIRNARGGNIPDVVQFAIDCERFGADGITVHPRPDERHITLKDVYDLKNVVTTELNIEGYPDERFLKLVKEIKPHQATLVPDPPNVLTSNAGWDIINNKFFLKEIISDLKRNGIRTSLFVDCNVNQIEAAKEILSDRIELYTGPYAENFKENKSKYLKDYVLAANKAKELNLGINAGHDLNLDNLRYFKNHLPNLDEVSIGHALISDALYLGLENTIQRYLYELNGLD
ncbi:MAG: pyridoxine 5'-phosphate synthase [Flavobacteriia bacterium]|nr:pyridoxine 5'-phosphate synthase [Flavobacteriia bacterium]